ncbi:MAG: STAS domain-containing protein [Hyphomicrobiales bacterium]
MEKLLPNDKIPRAAMQVVQDCLVVSVQVELYEETLTQLRTDLLEHIRTSGVRKAIFDLSSVSLLDPHAYNSICDTTNMARVMGTHAVVAGIRPGVASALVELGVDVRRTAMALNLEDGFVQLERLASEELEFEQVDAETNKDDEAEDNASDMSEPEAGAPPPPENEAAGP